MTESEETPMFDLTPQGIADLAFFAFFLVVLVMLAIGGPVMAFRMARGAFRDAVPPAGRRGG